MRTSIRMTSGAAVLGELGGRDAVTGLAHHLDVVLDAEEHRQPPTEELLVVDDQDADGLAARARAARSPRVHHGMSGTAGESPLPETPEGPVRTARASAATVRSTSRVMTP